MSSHNCSSPKALTAPWNKDSKELPQEDTEGGNVTMQWAVGKKVKDEHGLWGHICVHIPPVSLSSNVILIPTSLESLLPPLLVFQPSFQPIGRDP